MLTTTSISIRENARLNRPFSRGPRDVEAMVKSIGDLFGSQARAPAAWKTLLRHRCASFNNRILIRRPLRYQELLSNFVDGDEEKGGVFW